MLKTLSITFTRSGERTYRTTAVRADKVTLQVPSYDRKAWLPHDLAHYVVERELGLTHGFWGTVAEGALFPNMTVLAGRQKPDAAAHSKAIICALGTQGTEAEVLVSLLLHIAQNRLENNWGAARGLLAEAWQPPHPARAPLSAEEVRHVGAILHEFKARWEAVATGAGLTVQWAHQQWWPLQPSPRPANKRASRHRTAPRVASTRRRNTRSHVLPSLRVSQASLA